MIGGFDLLNFQRTNFSFEVNRNSEDDPRDPKVARKHTGFEAPPGADKYGVIKAKNGLTISTKLESEGSMIVRAYFKKI